MGLIVAHTASVAFFAKYSRCDHPDGSAYTGNRELRHRIAPCDDDTTGKLSVLFSFVVA